MASRGGVRAEGSDGSDFYHREKVASHYQVSTTYKSRMKFAIFLHSLLFFLMLAKTSTVILRLFNVDVGKIYGMYFPEPLLWEWIWMSSLVFSIYAYQGMQKNKVTMMKLSAWGLFIVGVFPIVGAAVYYLEDLLKYMQSDVDDIHIETFKGIPIAAIWYAFIGVAFQVHMLSIVFAIKLIEAWSPKSTKKAT